MSAYLSPIGNEQQADSNGAPVSGALITTYLAGTTTLVTTYTDAAGLVPQTNPIVCNSAGYPANPIYLPAGVAVKEVFTTSVASGSVAYRPPIDNIQGVNDPAFATTVSEWTAFSGTPTYISATSFSLVGDQTLTFQVNRRIKTTNTGGTVYSTIATSVFGAVTTITVTNTSGALDSGLSAVAYGFLAADNQSIPATNEAVNAQTGTTYTYAKSDKGKLVTHSNAAAIAGTLPIASSFGSGWWMDVQNRGAGTLTITPTTSTIDGAATLALTTGQGVRIVSDGTNYFTLRVTPKVINVVEATPYTTYTGTAVVLPYDNTIPQITEGLEIVTVTITPTSSTSRLRIEAEGELGNSSSAAYVSAALFQDATVNALKATGGGVADNISMRPFRLVHEMAAGTTSATTFRIRIGGNAGTTYINGNASSQIFGGVSALTLRVTEIAP